MEKCLTRSFSLPDTSDTRVQQSQHHPQRQLQLSNTSKVVFGGPDGGVDGTLKDCAVEGILGNVRQVGLRERGDLLNTLNPLANEFIPSSRPDMCSRQLNPFAKEFVPSPPPDMGSEQLNPFAEEFVPSFEVEIGTNDRVASSFEETAASDKEPIAIPAASSSRKGRRKVRGKNRTNEALAHSHENILRTIFVFNIDQEITEDQLAVVFMKCGEIADCRVCRSPNSGLGLACAFVEFIEPDSAKQALRLEGTMFGRYCIRVMPSRTAIVPLNTTLLPHSQDYKKRRLRTIHCKNIDPAANLKWFFEFNCGKVARLKFLDKYQFCPGGTALVEFETAESATIALNWSGYILSSFRISVSPSKSTVWL